MTLTIARNTVSALAITLMAAMWVPAAKAQGPQQTAVIVEMSASSMALRTGCLHRQRLGRRKRNQDNIRYHHCRPRCHIRDANFG
jgi:hypothetical protein